MDTMKSFIVSHYTKELVDFDTVEPKVYEIEDGIVCGYTWEE